MPIPVIYLYDTDGMLLAVRPAQADPAHEGRYLTDVLGGTCTPPPDSADEGFIPYWTETGWVLKESAKAQEKREEAERLAEAEALEQTRLRDPEARLAELASIRWQRQVSGIIVNDIALRTDRDSIVDLRVIAGRSPEKFPAPYKTASGFISLMTKEEATELADAQDAYVQACFTHEVVLSGLISDLSNDSEALAVLDLSKGWP